MSATEATEPEPPVDDMNVDSSLEMKAAKGAGAVAEGGAINGENNAGEGGTDEANAGGAGGASTSEIDPLSNLPDFYSYNRYMRYPKLSKIHTKERLNWAKATKPSGIQFWENIIFVDDITFVHENYDCETEEENKVTIHIWSAIAMRDKMELVLYDKPTKSSEFYLEMFEKFVVPFAQLNYTDGCSVQYSNASMLRATNVIDYLKTQDIEVLDWPSSGFDIAPFETIWNMLLLKLRLNKAIVQDEGEFFEMLQKEWEKIPIETIQKAIVTIPAKIDLLIKNKGKEFASMCME